MYHIANYLNIYAQKLDYLMSKSSSRENSDVRINRSTNNYLVFSKRKLFESKLNILNNNDIQFDAIIQEARENVINEPWYLSSVIRALV